ncbi:hypothetical protein SEA_GARDENB_9 [Microbacterium phage GardenB]|nr:hypothetical protein SEA_GARDENB_9 [Microbacterium phage GardenB]
MDELNALLQNLPGFALLTETQKQAALNGAQVPDSFGIWPGEEGYEVTYDVYFAALTLLGFLMAQPIVRSTSSEGTSISVDAPDWRALASYYRSQSVICNATGNGVLQRVTIPDVSHVRKVPMEGVTYHDVDTDLS